jgi:transcriptional regulator with XRE-family HTH domain
LSGRQLEERAGLRGRYVSDLEIGRLKHGPSISEVVQLAVALSVSPLALVLPWDEDQEYDEGKVLYVRQGTYGLVFPGGSAGVNAAARLWTFAVAEPFAGFINVNEYRTTLPVFSGRIKWEEPDSFEELEDERGIRYPDGSEYYPEAGAFKPSAQSHVFSLRSGEFGTRLNEDFTQIEQESEDGETLSDPVRMLEGEELDTFLDSRRERAEPDQTDQKEQP